MRVLFITRRDDHQLHSSLIQKLSPEQFLLSRQEFFTPRHGNAVKADYLNHHNWLVLAGDIENRSDIQPNRDGLLLSAFCLNDFPGLEEVLVVDNTSVDNMEVFTIELLSRCLLIAHNADHEARWFTATDFHPMRYACTLVNGRRLLSGMEGYRHDLISEINRWLGYDQIPLWMDKDIRNEFATCTYFRDEHILYNASDTIRLKDLYYRQRERAEELGQLFLHNTLNSRNIIPIAQTEVRGIRHNSEKWLDIARERKIKADKLCEELNEVVLNQYRINIELVNPAVRKEKEAKNKREARLEERKRKLEIQIKRLEESGKTHLRSYQKQLEQFQKIQSTQQTPQSTGLGDQPINWGSQKQVLEVFRQIGMILPQSKDKKTKQFRPSTDKEARANWFVNNEDSKYESFMKVFDTFKKTEHNIKSFGEKWVDQYVRNGRIYPSFDQAGTDTGRWTSGSKGRIKLHPNTSQIPAREGPEYRNCFEADDNRLFVTADWKNQEGVLIISMSQDMEMKKITGEKDQHGALGTRCYRAVYKHRYERTGDRKWLELSNTYVMDKSTPEGEKARNKFKNSAGLFPILYERYRAILEKSNNENGVNSGKA